MFPFRPSSLVRSLSIPRVSGDVSTAGLAPIEGTQYSPRERGCFQVGRVLRVDLRVFPA